MLSDLDEQEFQNLAASYQTLELNIYNVKRDIEAVLRIAARLKVCKDETVKGDAAIISSLEAVVARVTMIDALIGKRRADLVAESNARYHSQK